MTDSVGIHGHCDERFLAVRDAFAKNFEDGRDGPGRKDEFCVRNEQDDLGRPW